MRTRVVAGVAKPGQKSRSVDLSLKTRVFSGIADLVAASPVKGIAGGKPRCCKDPFVLILLYGAMSLPLVAQTTRGSITGTILDSQGASVPDATVTLRDVEKNIAFKTATNAAGEFLFLSLQPAMYVVAVEKSGFKRLAMNANKHSPQNALNSGSSFPA